MLRELTDDNEVKQLLSVLKKDVENCLYIYIDLKKYGLNNPNMKVWYTANDEKRMTVIMKYHDGFQIYSSQPEWEIGDVLELIQEYKPERISGCKFVVEQLEAALKGEYKAMYGAIFRSARIPIETSPPKDSNSCFLAQSKDISEITDLMLTEKEFNEHYSSAELMVQLEERYRTGMGRSMVIKEEDKIIGHIGTFAETEDVAVIAGSVMRKEYRNTDYYSILAGLFYDLICRIEQKDAYYFVVNKRHLKYYEKMMKPCATYGKLARITSEEKKDEHRKEN